MPTRVTYTFNLAGNFVRAGQAIKSMAASMGRSIAKIGPSADSSSRRSVRAFARMRVGAISLQTALGPLIAGFAGIAGVMKAFSIGTNFEDALADMSAITFATGKDLQFLKEESLRLGKASRRGAAETATAFKIVASAKSELLQDLPGLSKVTEQVLLLANASGMDLTSAANATAGALNAFGAGADQAARFVNVLAAGSKVGASEVNETAAALRDSGPIAKNVGVSFEELNGLIQVLAKNSIKGNIAGTNLRGTLLRLDTAADRNLRPSVVGIAKALENLSAKQLDTQGLLKLFGQENITTATILTKNIPLFKQFTREISGTDVAAQQQAIRFATVSSKLKEMGSILSNKIIQVFERLTPQLDDMIVGFGKWMDSITAEDLNGFAEGLKNVLGIISSLASATATLAKILGPVIGAGSKLLRASTAGLADLGTLISGGDLNAQTSASFQNAVRLEKSQTNIDVNLRDPGSAIQSVESTSSGTVSGLNVGINNLGPA